MISQEQYNDLIDELKSYDAELIAVSKFQPQSKIQALYDWGHRDFGENYVQELVDKQASLPADIRWHFIGHLQTNKVKYIAAFIHLIHSVDSYKLLVEINKQAKNNNRNISVLLQCYVGHEDTKYGLDAKEILDILEIYDKQKNELSHITIQGIMGMATNTDEEQIIIRDFKEMEALYENMKIQFFLGKKTYNTLCMGMSNDYQLAIQNGSNLVRIGSHLFGHRSR